MARTNFTDAQKAEIFVRDRATCAYSGVSLWLLDSGASGYYQADWVDHVKPACGGGASSIDNGVCASWLYNYAKGHSPHAGVQLFCKGLPTVEFFRLHHVMSVEQIDHFGRFSRLNITDWFFNRALWHITLGLDWVADSKRGQVRSRNDAYYAKAALKMISTWRKLVGRAQVTSLEKRGLATRSSSEDKAVMLTLRECETAQEIATVMQRLLPYHTANQAAFDGFLEHLYGSGSGSSKDFVQSVKNNPFVTPVVRSRILENARLVFSA
jgi:hypothetical protein